MKNTILKIENLEITVKEKNLKIINDISFNLENGNSLALIGESGSGKTVISMAIMGLLSQNLEKTCGNISIFGKDTSDLTPKQYQELRNKKIGLVMQNPMSAFNPIINIFGHFWENLASGGLKNKKEAKLIASQCLSEVGFNKPNDILSLYPFQMSGGMLQRVMLALALMSQPSLVIADEATSDLDVISQALILKLLQKYCLKENVSLLLITHDLSVAASLAENMVVLRKGKIVEKGKLTNIFKNPQSSYTAELLAAHRNLYTSSYKKIISKFTK